MVVVVETTKSLLKIMERKLTQACVSAGLGRLAFHRKASTVDEDDDVDDDGDGGEKNSPRTWLEKNRSMSSAIFREAA